MRSFLLAAAFFARDRAARTATLAAAGVALLLPRALALGAPGHAGAGFRAGLEAGRAAGTLAGPWGLLLLAAVPVLWQGIVSAHVGSGAFRTTLCRPLGRPAYYLARHAAALALVVAGASAAWLTLRVAAGSGAPGLGALLLAALATAWSLGSLLLLLSSLLPRGDVLAGVALLLAPGALQGIAPGTGALGAVAGVASGLLPPVLRLRDFRHALAAGVPPDSADTLVPLVYGAAALGLALLRLRTREYRGG